MYRKGRFGPVGDPLGCLCDLDPCEEAGLLHAMRERESGIEREKEAGDTPHYPQRVVRRPPKHKDIMPKG